MKSRVKSIFLVVLTCVLLSWLVIGAATLVTLSALKSQRFQVAKASAITAESLLTVYKPLDSISGGAYPILKAFLNSSRQIAFFSSHHTALSSFVDMEQPLDNDTRQQLLKHVSQLENNLSTITAQQDSFFYSLLTRSQPDLTATVQSARDVVGLSEQLLMLWQQQSKNQQTTTVLVLFQNNRELRPSGGFLGSYGLLSLEPTGQIRWEVQDIYVPDGQIKGHVNPPPPIQEAFQQGFWRLRDANWHSDFPSAAERVSWFFTEGTGITPDVVVGLQYEAFIHFLTAIEPIYLPNQQQYLSSANAYEYLQRLNEPEFFAGSTLKKDTLTEANTAIRQKLSTINASTAAQLLQIFSQEIKEKGIVMASRNSDMQQWLACHNWSGSLLLTACEYLLQPNFTFAINEANLGVNKTNCCIDRKMSWQLDDKTIQLQLEYTSQPIPEELSTIAGDYKSFVRVYTPEGAELNSLQLNQQDYASFIQQHKQENFLSYSTSSQIRQDKVLGLTEIGFWVYVKQAKPVTVNLNFTLSQPFTGTARFVKQPGTLPFFNQLTISNQGNTAFEGEMKTDVTLTMKQ